MFLNKKISYNPIFSFLYFKISVNLLWLSLFTITKVLIKQNDYFILVILLIKHLVTVFKVFSYPKTSFASFENTQNLETSYSISNRKIYLKDE